eukprot:TRINITY_DN3831_c0_g1_i1.p1 TRINITY_DN3831_c0_g1~~TRINITY_DN3831_c0_g1_i1.p1  ORF type:complete len:107 (-),score=10.25 TRINITY_DN3831_c0_g1_i1:16-336(-)
MPIELLPHELVRQVHLSHITIIIQELLDFISDLLHSTGDSNQPAFDLTYSLKIESADMGGQEIQRWICFLVQNICLHKVLSASRQLHVASRHASSARNSKGKELGP